MASIDFKTFLNVVYHVIENRNPILIRGRHGIGKSEVVDQVTLALGLLLVQRRASQMTEGDLLGLPSIEDGATTWNSPDWMKTACNQPCVLFLDEVDRASQEVRQGIFELTDSRQLAGNKLHEGTIIIAAINGGDAGAMYSVGDMDPAELDRYTVFDLEPTVEDWLAWAEDNCHEYVVEFIRDNPTALEQSGDLEPNKVYPSRRSWKRLNDCLTRGLLDDICDSSKKDGAKATISTLSAAYIGFENSVLFCDFLEEGVQITIEDMLQGRLDQNRIKGMGLNQHNALIDRIETKKTFKRLLNESELKNLAFYLYNIPAELCMRLYAELGVHLEKNVLALGELEIEGKAFELYIAEVVGGTFDED